MNGASTSEWQGRRWWLIGASEGVGRDLARLMSRAGAELILSARNVQRLETLREELPGRATVVPVDVCDRDSVRLAAAAAGALDGVVYLAGCWTPFRAGQWQPGAAETMIETGLLGAVRVLDHVVPEFVAARRGHVVLIGGLSAFRGLRLMAGNGSAKAGLLSLAETLHAELAPLGIRVQLVNPGFVRTRQTAAYPRRMPGLMEPVAAAREIWEHMSTDRFQKSFPLGLALMARLGRLAPLWLWERLGR